MSLESLIQVHGYWVVLLGTLIEGETILLLGGVAAHHGYLQLYGVVLAAFTGSFLCDQLFFHLGRRHGPAVLRCRPGWAESVGRVDALLVRYDTLLILGFRFLYGLRTVTPLVIGMSAGVTTPRFLLLNAAGAAIWSLAIGWAGFALGNAAEALLGRARHYELASFAVVAALGLLIWGVYFIRTRRSRQAPPANAR